MEVHFQFYFSNIDSHPLTKVPVVKQHQNHLWIILHRLLSYEVLGLWKCMEYPWKTTTFNILI